MYIFDVIYKLPKLFCKKDDVVNKNFEYMDKIEIKKL
jgi:hypothetical protein